MGVKIMKFKTYISFCLVFTFSIAGAFAGPRTDDAKRIIAELTSRPYWGRGYTRGGMQKAGEFLAKEVASYGLKPLDGESFFQPFEFPVNTFPTRLKVNINGRRLVPGLDYIVQPASSGVKARGDLVRKDDTHFSDPSGRVKVTLKDKLTWSVSRKVLDTTEVILDAKRMKEEPTRFKIDIENRFIERFKTANICAFIPGTEHPDHFIVLSAHYDHLGGMGRRTFFPGANDNASGVAFLLGLAKYYAAHPQPSSIVFLFFAGEEAGLMGSKYFVDHPLIDLKKIRFVTNFDMVGTGNEGATVVNATEFAREFSLLERINLENDFLPKLKARGRAPNSDHYWFSEKGVPAFFLYTMGGIRAYHDTSDRAQTLPLDQFEDLFELVVKFNSAL